MSSRAFSTGFYNLSEVRLGQRLDDAQVFPGNFGRQLAQRVVRPGQRTSGSVTGASSTAAAGPGRRRLRRRVYLHREKRRSQRDNDLRSIIKKALIGRYSIQSQDLTVFFPEKKKPLQTVTA